MGQKVHPYGFRLGIIKTWNSKWFEDKSYAKWLHEDIRIKRAVKEYLQNAGIAGVEIERAANKCKVIVFTARPGMVIGKGGKGIETLKTGNLKTAAKGERGLHRRSRGSQSRDCGPARGGEHRDSA
jgi:small subunit ribosomal protein S3